jgi:hypothetical protein
MVLIGVDYRTPTTRTAYQCDCFSSGCQAAGGLHTGRAHRCRIALRIVGRLGRCGTRLLRVHGVGLSRHSGISWGALRHFRLPRSRIRLGLNPTAVGRALLRHVAPLARRIHLRGGIGLGPDCAGVSRSLLSHFRLLSVYLRLDARGIGCRAYGFGGILRGANPVGSLPIAEGIRVGLPGGLGRLQPVARLADVG